jgi:hypothetical protein
VSSAMRSCPVAGCETLIADSLLLCHEHWQRVPFELRRRAWASFHGALDALRQTGRVETDAFLEARKAAADQAARTTLGDLLEQLPARAQRRAA